MDLSRFIVRVERENGGLAGTGCAVGPDLVLTALHVVWPGYGPENATPCTTALRAMVAEQPAHVIWPLVPIAPDHLDAALLRVEGEPMFADWLDVDPEWTVGAPFDSRGFPDADGPVDPHGTLARHDARDLERLTIVSPKPTKDVAWHGMSGAPVVVAWRVRGVIVLRVDGWPSILDAVPMASIVGAPGFTDHVRPPDHSRPLAKAIREMLVGDPGLEAAIRAAGDGLDDDVAAHLVRLPTAAALGVVQTAHGRAVAAALSSRGRADRALAGALFRLAGLIAACRAPCVESTAWGGYRVVAFSLAGIELAAARRDGRGTAFSGTAAVTADPSPEFAMPLHPDKGPVTLPALEAHPRKRLGIDDDVPAQALNDRVRALRELVHPDHRVHIYFAGRSKQLDGADDVLRQFTARYPHIPVYVRETSTALDAHTAEAQVVPMLSSIYLEHQKLLSPDPRP